MHKFTVLITEDEKQLYGVLSKILTANGYRTSWAASGMEAISLASSLCPDIILLDLGLPDIDGMEVISQIRTWSGCPIIVISARDSEEDKVRALDAGADDYITKPIESTYEMLARIRTCLRHSAQAGLDHRVSQQPYQSNGLEIDFLRRSVSLDGTLVHLTPIEYKIVAFLAQNSGKVVTYAAVIKNVWGPYAESDNKILRVNMANIRRKLEKNPAQPIYIFTEVGVGYRMAENGMLNNP
ncbi:response regulator transcription factor [Lachnospiraceae bacterium 29-84]